MIAVSFAVVLAIGLCDWLTSEELSLAIFYLAPVLASSWTGGRTVGLAMAGASAVVSVSADVLAGLQYSSFAFHIWAGVMRTGFFALAVSLLVALRDALARERALARGDPLTGLSNRTAFFESADAELTRAQRYGHPLTVAFIDCDHFKEVNDSRGHLVGDQVLISVARTLRGCLRASDLVARFGGDEFALLFPELGAVEARTVIAKLRQALRLEMQARGWPVTFSIGVVTCAHARPGFDALVARADALMYEVKAAGRDDVSFAELDPGSSP